MSSGITLILIVAGAYLAAHLAFEQLARRFLIVSGAEYLLLGILLGPKVSGLISASVIDSFGPFMTLAIGWMGAVIGSQLYLPALLRVRAISYQTAALESVLCGAVVAGVMAGVFHWIYGLPSERMIVPAVALGAVATASSLSAVSVAGRRLLRRTELMRQLQVASVMDACVAVAAFGLLTCIAHAPPPGPVRTPTPTEWAVIGIGIGAIGGALFHLFLGSERHTDRLFISLVGAITLASGAAAYVRLSPLMPTLLIGAILINTSRNRQYIRRVLVGIQRPLYFVLLIFAGAAWEPSERKWLLVIALFFIVRIAAKIGSARLSARIGGVLPALGPNWGRALLGQGALAAAIGLNYRIYDNSLLPNVVFTVAIVSVLLTDLLSAHFVRAAQPATEEVQVTADSESSG